MIRTGSSLRNQGPALQPAGPWFKNIVYFAYVKCSYIFSNEFGTQQAMYVLYPKLLILMMPDTYVATCSHCSVCMLYFKASFVLL